MENQSQNGESYILAGCKSWHMKLFNETVADYPGHWFFAGKPEKLSPEWVRSISPRYIFFLHWPEKVPDELIENFECVCFHMTDVPYGRGGSPLQNLIAKGHKKTMLTAMKMDSGWDTGPVYMKQELCLEGLAEEIYIRASRIAAGMIKQIITERPTPVAQSGEVTVFTRRSPDQSEIHNPQDLDALFDHIRMLDAEGYPRAYFTYNGFRFEFSRPALREGRIVADVNIMEDNEPDKEEF